MVDAGHQAVVERLFAGLNAGDVSVMNATMVDDSVISWPQSGERIVGRANRQAMYEAFPSLPTIRPYRFAGDGDVVVAEAELDYPTETLQTVFIVEFRGDRIAVETVYWAKPFEAPAWRAAWVERSAPG